MKHLYAFALFLISLSSCPGVHAQNEKDTPPLVSATELDSRTLSDITFAYPNGITVFSDSLSPALEQRLLELEKSGYPIVRTTPDRKLLQQLTAEVIKHDQLQAFLQRVYSENPGCPTFMTSELLLYGLRGVSSSTLNVLEQLSPDDYRRIIAQHHWWKNLGYDSQASAPEPVQQWLSKCTRTGHSDHLATLDSCGLSLNRAQMDAFGQLIGLSYLSNTVRGLYYRIMKRKNTHYRQLAVDVTDPLSQIHPVRTDTAHQD
ncbi:hypothetical protein GZ77_00540 [Endozoicomonas montiporae]|uniref:Uncharacterized protein n=2 Tax=Endozoicomonas montiporae TaxID=1027273 RepID=A0A081N9U2_9GAMM|nr:hypothetical protein [Endozoicomonas montiporae]AMO57125.1 hypothetical protein EZMO1_3117 [Endozoicomonas montiporae CL-33]KEQ15215.1 hypothetical protein GZ77_00540 [Endozoicomonas montiporae]